MSTHPKGTNARILLSSVFGPYAQDDEFGSRTINPMELYHNQVTREQRLSHADDIVHNDSDLQALRTTLHTIFTGEHQGYYHGFGSIAPAFQ